MPIISFLWRKNTSILISLWRVILETIFHWTLPSCIIASVKTVVATKLQRRRTLITKTTKSPGPVGLFCILVKPNYAHPTTKLSFCA